MGASIGRENAPKLMGGASASVLAGWERLSAGQRRLLMACGGGAVRGDHDGHHHAAGDPARAGLGLGRSRPPPGSLYLLAAGFGSASGLLAHVLTGAAHGAPSSSAAGPGAMHAGAAYGVLFADVAALTAEPALSEAARGAVLAVAGHLAAFIRRAQDDGDARPGADPDAAAWLVLSALSACRLRAAVMPDGLEPPVTALALGALAD